MDYQLFVHLANTIRKLRLQIHSDIYLLSMDHTWSYIHRRRNKHILPSHKGFDRNMFCIRELWKFTVQGKLKWPLFILKSPTAIPPWHVSFFLNKPVFQRVQGGEQGQERPSKKRHPAISVQFPELQSQSLKQWTNPMDCYKKGENTGFEWCISTSRLADYGKGCLLYTSPSPRD